jgi:hypothetical protein
MESPTSKPLSAAVLRLLRPLVRLLLRNGVSYGAFADLAKWVFVDVASKEFGVQGRKQTDSRVSVVTGLSRKEVARVKQIDAPDDAAAAKQYNRAARVISGWLRDSRFVNPQGKPAVLPFEGDGSTFSDLVRAYSGDMTARAILDELERVRAVEREADGRVRLAVPAYIPSGSSADKLHILGTDVAFLMDTIEHNLQEGQEQPYFQRKVAYDNLPVEAIPKLRELTHKKGQELLVELDRYLSQQDRDANPSAKGTGRKHAGVGIYYFENDVPREE